MKRVAALSLLLLVQLGYNSHLMSLQCSPVVLASLGPTQGDQKGCETPSSNPECVTKS